MFIAQLPPSFFQGSVNQLANLRVKEGGNFVQRHDFLPKERAHQQSAPSCFFVTLRLTHFAADSENISSSDVKRKQTLGGLFMKATHGVSHGKAPQASDHPNG